MRVQFTGTAKVEGFYELDDAKVYREWIKAHDQTKDDEALTVGSYEAFSDWLREYAIGHPDQIDYVSEPDDCVVDQIPVTANQFHEAIWDELLVKPVRQSKGQIPLWDVSAI